MAASASSVIEFPAAARAESPWWRPTFADLLVLALLTWTFLLSSSGALELVGDANTGMHIRTGDLIRQTGAVPQTDPYSFSLAGQPWFAWEWLTAVTYSLLNGAFGLPGVSLLSIAVLGAAFAVTTRTMARTGGVALVVVPLVFFAFRASSLHFLARPHLFTWLFLALTVALIEADRRKASGNVWYLVPLSLLWTNMHGGFLTMPVYLGLVTVGLGLERHWSQAKRYAMLAAATGAVTLINPYGWAVHRHIWETLNSKWLAQMVQEFQPPWAMPMPDERVYLFYAIGALAVVAAAGLVAARRFVEPMLIAFFLYAATRSVRHVPIFLIATLPAVAAYYSSLWLRAVAGASRKSSLAIIDELSRDITPQLRSLSPIGLALFVLSLAVPGHFGMPLDFSPEKFPTALIATHSSELRQSRLMTHDGWADYLIFHGYPEQKVWIDGRNDFFGPKFGEEYFALLDAEPQTAAILERWRFDAILIKPSTKLAVWLKSQPAWEEQARDKSAVLFRRRVLYSPPTHPQERAKHPAV